ncbi:MAG: DUF1109 family protein [Myxococcales bacterium]|nr:DUF1109 family protein [Myxococcales bacterium]
MDFRQAPSWTGAALGAAAGAWAGVFVDLWCPLSNAEHVAGGHALPMLILVAVGAVAGVKVLGLRSAAGGG